MPTIDRSLSVYTCRRLIDLSLIALQARTDPKAMWLYQGWAIRGWNNAEGASRLKALSEVVPQGQWVVSDMDVEGIWRYVLDAACFVYSCPRLIDLSNDANRSLERC